MTPEKYFEGYHTFLLPIQRQPREGQLNLLEKWRPFDISNWYQQLRDVTIPCVFIPLSMEETEAILDGKGPSDLLEKIDKSIKSFGGSAFIRLNTRSLKSAIERDIERLKPIFIEEIKTINVEDFNQVSIAIKKSVHKALRFSDALNTISYFKKCEKCVLDMDLALEFADEIDFNMAIVVRQFIDIPPSREFRVFIYGGNVTAISQYHKDCYFPELLDKKDEYQNRIIDFWKAIKISIESLSYLIIDIVVYDDSIQLIDINPFDQHTNAGLFAWEREINLLCSTQGKVEFRVVENPTNYTRLKFSYEELLDVINKEQDNENKTSGTSSLIAGAVILGLSLSLIYTFVKLKKRIKI